MRCAHCGGTLWSVDQDGDIACFMCGRYQKALQTEQTKAATMRTCHECREYLPIGSFPRPLRGMYLTKANIVCSECKVAMVS